MQVKRFSEIKGYDAPNHRACSTLRVFGVEAGGTKSLIVGVSHFLPGGGAGPDASPPEKVYFVLEGELTVIVDGKETVLKKRRFLLHRPEREPRDHQSRQRSVLDPGRHRAAEMKTLTINPSFRGASEAREPGIRNHRL